VGNKQRKAAQLEENHGPWLGVGFAQAQGLALSFSNVAAQRLHHQYPDVSLSFLAFFHSKNFFYHSIIFSFRYNVKIINTLRGNSLTIARFTDTRVAGTIYPKALASASGPS